MSSILRALKKLDEETLSRENSNGAQEHEPSNTETNDPQNNIKRVVNRRTRDRRAGLKKVYFIVFPVVFLMGAAAVLIFDWNAGSEPAKSSVPITEKQPGTLQVQKNLPPLKQTQAQPQSVPQPDRPGKKEPAALVETPHINSTDTQTSPSTPGSTPTLPQKNVQRADPTPKPGPTVNPSAPKTTSLQRIIPAKPKPQKANRPNLSLDGILWSQKPERRVAVINGNYYKVGDSIKGFIIFEIKKNQVILQSGEDRWSLHLK